MKFHKLTNFVLFALICNYFQAYLDELVELHRRLMTLRERHILQQVRTSISFKQFSKTKILLKEQNISVSPFFITYSVLQKHTSH